MQNSLIKSVVAASLLVLSLAAEACGYTGGAGDLLSFSLDNPLDISILVVMFGTACAFIPERRKTDQP